MQNSTLDTAMTPAGSADATEFNRATPAQDPAGGITLSGRGRAGARARVLSGMVLTAGLVAAVNGQDTVSSFTYGHAL